MLVKNQQVYLPFFGINKVGKVLSKTVSVKSGFKNLLQDSFVQTPAFQDFVGQLKRVYPTELIMNVLFHSACPENLLGSGTYAKVYEIPNVKDYVLRVLHNTKKEDFFKSDVLEIKDEFPNYNFGQKIGDNYNGITVLKRVYGVPQGLSNPSEKDLENNFLIEHAREILNQISDISNFPLESFEDFALKIKEINKSPKYILDSLNSNNLLVDKENLKLNVVDLSDKQKFVGLNGANQDADDMVSLLLNMSFHQMTYDKLPTKAEKDLFKRCSKIIMAKTYKAAKKVGLEASKMSGEERLKVISDYCLKFFKKDLKLLSRYDGFNKMYKEYFNKY